MKSSLLKIFALLFLTSALALAQQPVNVTTVGGGAVATGNGTNSGAMRVVIASDNTAFPVNATLSAETTKVIGTVRNLGNAGGIFDTTAGATAAANSVQVGGVYNSSAPTPSTGQQEPFQLDSAANLKVNCVTGCASGGTITLVPATSGGVSMSHLLLAASNNATSLKGSAGQLYGASVYNNAGYPFYLKFYNKPTSPTPASDTVVYEVPVQAGTEREFHSEQGLAFSTGIAYAVVKGISDTDNTSVSASDGTVDLIYK